MKKRFILAVAAFSSVLACGPAMDGSSYQPTAPDDNHAFDLPSSNNIQEILADQSIPEKVKTAMARSEVWVEVYSRKRAKETIFDFIGSQVLLVGSVVGDHLVLTCHHALNLRSAYGAGGSEQTRIITVGWDGETFMAQIVDEDERHDLLLLKVSDPKNVFQKEPISIVSTPPAPGDRRLPWFAYGVIDENFFAPREFHRFLGHLKSAYLTHIADDTFVLDQGVQEGFSGAPVFDSDGMFRGMISGTLWVSTIAITADQVSDFLKKYHGSGKSKLNSPVRPR